MDIWARLDSRLKRLWAGAQLALADDTKVLQVAQVQIGVGGPAALSETIDQVPRISEYGFFSCPPDGAQAVVLFLGGHRSAAVIIATGNRATRFKNLQKGEAGIGNELTGSCIKFAADGLAHLNCGLVSTGQVEGASLKADNGATGTFIAESGQTITVTNGIITSIA